MSERDGLNRRLADLRSLERGLASNVSDYQRRISAAQRARADAGRHHDALLRQQQVELVIRDWESSIRSAERESARVRNEIRGIESELRSLK